MEAYHAFAEEDRREAHGTARERETASGVESHEPGGAFR